LFGEKGEHFLTHFMTYSSNPVLLVTLCGVIGPWPLCCALAAIEINPKDLRTRCRRASGVAS
jgi:hypothetical protein